ncbi:hypothetical protein DFH08DRAFT_808534 [Mycena albidolilacea]|uniref:Uncharacterized protein n=1 Tax=Mycena albidolilacea TaxID=1033008 RepID=A0AAD7ET25_9AGAR|nr:hypothetical protein DFH08DRAFT_808534 [Mycena albidolilacea]
MRKNNWMYGSTAAATCLVCVQYDIGSDYEECKEEGGENEFRTCRIPYEEVDRIVAGLGVADLWFRDFVDEAGPQEDGCRDGSHLNQIRETPKRGQMRISKDRRRCMS